MQARACAPYAAALYAPDGAAASEPLRGATIADGIALKRPGRLTLVLLRELLDGLETVTEEEILEAANKQLAEAGRAPLAALRIARTDADYPLGPTGKVLKRELRTRFATLLQKQPA